MAAVTHDSVGGDTTVGGSGGGPYSWTHTPVGALKGVVVFLTQPGITADVVSSVTYGGVAMTRVDFAVDSAGEAGQCYCYFLGSGIPTGAQSVSFLASGTVSAYVISYGVVTDDGSNTQEVAHGKIQVDTLNPSVTLATIAGYDGMCYSGIFSGLAAPTSLTAGAGYTAANGADHGQTASTAELGAKTGANVACGWTAASDDVAMVAVAVGKVPAAAFVARPVETALQALSASVR